MRRLAVVLAGALLLAACGSADDDHAPEPTGSEPEPSASETPSASPTGPRVYELAGCPVTDETFCGTAVEVIQALQAADVEALFNLSREDRLVCAEVATEYFPGCETDDVLEGYGLSGPEFLVEVVDAEAYRGQLAAIVNEVEPSFSDDLGDGGVQVIGVGTCGPEDPDRRSYHIAWTAAVSERGAPPERLLGSFELNFKDGEWRIALWYLGPLVEWEAQHQNPLELNFCEAGRSPWST